MSTSTFCIVFPTVVYIIGIFICFIAILVYERIADEIPSSILYGEAMGWFFVASLVWPIVLIVFIWSIFWKNVVKKICVSLVENLVSKFNH